MKFKQVNQVKKTNMNTVNIKEQQANEILKLEISYINLKNACDRGYRNEIIEAIVSALLSNPGYFNKLKSGIDNVFIKQYGNNFLRNINWILISDQDVLLNAEGCMNAIEDILAKHKFYQENHTYAQNILYSPNHTFKQEDVLYHNKQNQQLNVADLLKVVKYSINIAEAIEPNNENFSNANAAISVLQGIEATLSNKSTNKPVNTMLHLVTNFISSAVKSSLNDESSKRGVTITSTLIDLAIDFFCKK